MVRANDVALLKLKEPAVLGSTVMPPYLPELGDFGDSSSFNPGQYRNTKILQKVQKIQVQFWYTGIILYNTLQGVWDKLAEMFLYCRKWRKRILRIIRYLNKTHSKSVFVCKKKLFWRQTFHLSYSIKQTQVVLVHEIPVEDDHQGLHLWPYGTVVVCEKVCLLYPSCILQQLYKVRESQTLE